MGRGDFDRRAPSAINPELSLAPFVHLCRSNDLKMLELDSLSKLTQEVRLIKAYPHNVGPLYTPPHTRSVTLSPQREFVGGSVRPSRNKDEIETKGVCKPKSESLIHRRSAEFLGKWSAKSAEF